jgi:hypothetical protein
VVYLLLWLSGSSEVVIVFHGLKINAQQNTRGKKTTITIEGMVKETIEKKDNFN